MGQRYHFPRRFFCRLLHKVVRGLFVFILRHPSKVNAKSGAYKLDYSNNLIVFRKRPKRLGGFECALKLRRTFVLLALKVDIDYLSIVSSCYILSYKDRQHGNVGSAREGEVYIPQYKRYLSIRPFLNGN